MVDVQLSHHRRQVQSAPGVQHSHAETGGESPGPASPHAASAEGEPGGQGRRGVRGRGRPRGPHFMEARSPCSGKRTAVTGLGFALSTF